MWKNDERYLKYVWSFFKIMQERVKMTIDDTYLRKKFQSNEIILNCYRISAHF